MKSNILLVSLDYEFTQNVAKNLSGLFDMFYLDIKGLITYTLSAEQNVIDKVGVEYFDKQVQKIVLSAREYENTVINIPYDLYIKDNNYQTLNNACIAIFLNVKKADLEQLNLQKDEYNKLTIQLIAYEELCLAVQNCAKFCIKLDNADINDCTNKIKQLLKNSNITELL